MPELAEVEAVRGHLDKILKGKRITDVEVDDSDKFLFMFAPAKDVVKALKGAKIKGSGRWGKYFWLELDRKPWPIFHLGMTGNIAVLSPKSKGSHEKIWGGVKLWSEGEAKDRPERLWFCRFLLTMNDGTEVALLDPRRFGRMWLTDDPLNHPRIKKLGFDPLHNFPTAKGLVDKLKRRRAPIKAVLMDQALFAGVGNWLADEILFQAKLSPHTLASDLKPAQVAKLREKILGVVKHAVKVKADYDRFPKDWLFHVRWGKAKDAKTSKGAKIIHEEIGGRTTAWVPSLQK